MKSFKQFINEETLKIKPWEEADVEERTAISIINKNCTDALRAFSTGALLFRGINSDVKFRKVDSSTGIRTSRDTNNIYQLLFDNSESFANYPKRSKSMICSNNHGVAVVYGKVHVVLPFNGTKLAISNNMDFIRQKISAPILGTGNTILLMRLGKFMQQFLQALGIHSNQTFHDDDDEVHEKYTSIESINSQLSKFDPITLTMVWNEALDNMFQTVLMTYDSVPEDIRTDLYSMANLKTSKKAEAYINKNGFPSIGANIFYKMMRDNPQSRMTALASYLITPKRISIKLEDYANYVDSSGETLEREIWFSGPAMIVSKTEAKKIIQTLKDQGEKIDSNVEKLLEK